MHDDLALGIHHDRPPVEDQFILATDEVDVDHGDARLPDPPLEQRLPLQALAGMKGRGVDVDEQARPGVRGLQGRSRAERPDVLANGDARRHAPDVDDAGGVPRREIALFVEHAVVGQQLLAVAGDDLPAADHGSGIVELPLLAQGMPDDGRHLRDLAGQVRHGLVDVVEKVRPEQQVLRRIAAQGEFREHHDVRGQFVPRATAGAEDLVRIAPDIADQEVELGHDEAQTGR